MSENAEKPPPVAQNRLVAEDTSIFCRPYGTFNRPANRAQALGACYQGGTVGMFDGKVVIVTGGGKATLKDGSAGSIGYGIDIAFAK